MLKNNIQATEHSSALTNGLWDDISQQVEGLDTAPTHIVLKKSNWAQVRAFDIPIEIYHYFTDISPDKKRLMYSYNVTQPDTFKVTTHIDVYNTESNTLNIEAQFTFEDFDISFQSEAESNIYNFRQAQFMGNDHIAIALATGYLKILSIENNSIFLEQKIAGLVSTLTCSETHLATSLFPGIEEKLYHACGVKIYRISDIIEEKKLEPCKIIGGDDFSILPHSLRFHPQKDRFLCKGSKILKSGYVNYIEEYDFKKEQLTTIFEENDKKITQRISNYSAAGDYCVVSNGDLKVNNSRHKTIWKPELPDRLKTDGVKNCKLSEDGSKIIIFKKGILYLVQKDRQKARQFETLGSVSWAHFLSDNSIIFGLHKLYSFDIKIMNINDGSMKTSLNGYGNIESINPDGYTFSSKGDLLISDSEGRVRKIGPTLLKQSLVYQPYGCIRQLDYDPVPGQNVILTESGAVLILDPETGKMHLKIGKTSQKPVGPGSGYNYIHTSENMCNKDDGIWMCADSFSLSIEFPSNHYLEIKKKSAKLELSDSNNGTFSSLLKIELNDAVVDSAKLKDHALILLKNGSIIKVDPYDIPDSVSAVDSLKIFPVLIENIEFPRGICDISDTQFAVWSNDAIFQLSVLNETAHIETSEKISGIKRIKWDKINHRFVIAFKKYIAFYSLNLNEMYRLYLLRDNGYLIHVPFPQRLKTGINKDHPGYYWSESDCAKLFDVQNKNKASIKNELAKQNFLSEYFQKIMVETAIRDYEHFYQILNAAEYDEMGSSGPLLLGI